MDRRDFRPLTPTSVQTSARARAAARPAALVRLVGRALGLRGGGSPLGTAGVEVLESRILLNGTFDLPLPLTLDGTTGEGVGAVESINPATPSTDNDVYSFVAPATDFVSILADTSNQAGSTLNTRIRLFNAARQEITPAGQGLGNSTLTSGLQRDGWVGFVATAGQTYFVQVSSDTTGAPAGSGAYRVRLDATTTTFDVGGETPLPTGIAREAGSPVPGSPVPPITPILGQLGGLGTVANRIRQDDIVYRYDVPAGALWDSLVTINAQHTRYTGVRLDTRLDVYDGQGNLIAADSDAGRINDAFTTIRARPGETFFIRVRSDEVRASNISLATGPFFLVVDAIATTVNLDPVRRVVGVSDAFAGFGAPSVAADPSIPAPTFQTKAYSFVAQGTGLAFVTIQPTGLAPVNDPAVRLLDKDGALLAFNDNAVGLSAQIIAQLTGGEQYFVVVDGFEVSGAVQYTVDIEANHTFDPGSGLDDHADTPILPQTPTQADLDTRRRQFESATGLVFGNIFATFDADGNLVKDRSVRVNAVGTGRIYEAGDTDIFQFTAPVDVLSDKTGNNDDAGTSLFVGGAFTRADASNPWTTDSRSLAIWDADDWFFVGRQTIDVASGLVFGFNDNPLTPATPDAHIRAMATWDPDGPGPQTPVLVVGGDFELVVPSPFPLPPRQIRNLAAWQLNPVTGRGRWITINNAPPTGVVNVTDGPVHAIATYDPPPRGDPEFDPNLGEVPQLFVGGSFSEINGVAANNLALFPSISGTWEGIGGLADPVNALTVFTPADPGDERAEDLDVGLTFTPDVPEPLRSLAIGGSFPGGVRLWDGAGLSTLSIGAPGTPLGSIDGPVFALSTWDAPDPDGVDGPLEPRTLLAIGGSFTQAGDIAAGNVVVYGNDDPTQDPETSPVYTPRLVFEALGSGTNGPVFALTNWNAPDIADSDPDSDVIPVLVVGGSFSDLAGSPAGNIAAWRDGVLNLFGDGTDAAVLSLVSIPGATEIQEPGIVEELDSGIDQDALYVGGDFTLVSNGGPNPPITVNRVAQYSAFTGPFANDDFFSWRAMGSGVSVNDDPSAPVPFTGVTSVFALAVFDDGNPNEWDRHDRRANRMALTVSPTTGSFINALVRVYDSNFALVYDFDRPGSDTISPPFPDPAGMVDGSVSAPAFNTAFEGIKLWGGETYYIEVSSTPGGTGRYALSLTVDGFAQDRNGDGNRDDVNARYAERAVDQGAFERAQAVNTTLANGDGAITNGANTPPFARGNDTRIQKASPTDGTVASTGDIGNISTINDTDLYTFRAEFTGTVEVRIATTQLSDLYGEVIGPDFRPDEKIYDSRLDAAVRIFRNDFEQIAYNDDPAVVRGEFTDDAAGTIAARFARRDPRLVFEVVQGNTYFIQVESGALYIDGAPADPSARVVAPVNAVDTRYATGSYQLLINQMPNLFADSEAGQPTLDDHIDAVANQATVLPINETLGDPANGTASILGFINGTPGKPIDVDSFRFAAVSDGFVTITLSPTAGGLLAQMTVFNATPDQSFVGQATPTANGAIAITFLTFQGQQFLINVQGQGGTEGSYRIDYAGTPFADDHASFPDLVNASDLQLFDFLGQGSITGILEGPGDTDVFRFGFDEFARLTADVVSGAATLNPRVDVYEVSEDFQGRPLLLRIGFNDNLSAGDTNARSIFSVTPNRTIEPLVGPVRDYPFYYVVVSGSDPDSDFGAYTLTLTFPPTDDHADGDTDGDDLLDTGEFDLATSIVVDTTSGVGASTGTIESPADTDLFRFTVPAGGPVTVRISRPDGSLIRPRVTLLDAAGNVLGTPGVGDDDLITFAATTSITGVRNVTYFLVVEGFDGGATPNAASDDFGAYTVSVVAQGVDDHPNDGEFDLATPITLANDTGDGQVGSDAGGDPSNPRLLPDTDTDLFTFVAGRAGSFRVVVSPFDTAVGRVAPRLRIFAADRVTVLADIVATTRLQEVSFTIPAAVAGDRYYLLVTPVSGVLNADLTGEYRVLVDGPAAGTQPGGPDTSDIDFAQPVRILLDARTGDGLRDDVINVSGDRDLFVFTSTVRGRIFVQVTTPDGSLLDASVRLLRNANELPQSSVAFDTDGIPGVTANVAFDGEPGRDYYVIVDGLGASVGSYTVRVNTQPVTNFAYFPEGFTNDNIREFLSLVNPNAEDATYTVRLRYEFGQFETVIANGLVRANSRDGLTITDGLLFRTPGVIPNVPYAVIVESSLPLGATLARYDFGSAIGDNFTETLSPTWSFPRVERDPANVADFLVFYNPSDFDIDVTLTAYGDGGTTASVTTRFAAGRRGGFSINNLLNLPQGVFSVILTSRAADAANQPAFAGIVASISHYELGGGSAFGLLGDATGGSSRGAVTNISQGAGIDSEVVFFNPGNLSVSVTLTGRYIRQDLPQFSRNFQVPARGRVVIPGANLGLISGQPAGFTYASSGPVHLVTQQQQLGDADATSPATIAATRFFFGDAFLFVPDAGTKYFETLFLYNPAAVDTDITVKLLFIDGTSATFIQPVDAGGFAEIQLHRQPELVVDRTGNIHFSVDLSAPTPFNASMVHYDLFLGGGWATTGIPFGITTPISRILST